MNEPKPLTMTAVPGSGGWLVLICTGDGVEFHIPGFANEELAQDWIDLKGPAWVREWRRG